MWNDTDTPLAYFISFRTHGTWLHEAVDYVLNGQGDDLPDFDD